MKTRILTLLPLVVFCFLAPVSAQNEFTVSIPEGFATPGRLFVVKHTGDSADANPGDGVCADSGGNCTLRAAVDESNANNAPADVIIFELAYPAVIELTEGTLNLSEIATSIIGPGARRLTIRRSSAAAIPFRIFNVTNADVRSLTRIRGLRLEGGFAGNFIAGGAVRIGPGAATDLTDMWITGNSGGAGGAISNEGTLTISRSLLTGNTANTDGGAMHLTAGSNTRITNSTITLNSASTGGAIYAAGTLLLVNNTITHNAASTGASSIASASGATLDVLNTIVGSDTSLPITTLSGTFNSLGSNIVTDARTATGFTNGVNNDQVSDSNAIDPLVGPLADNGGQTDTRALLVNSPAIDHGNSCVYDGTCSGIASPTLRLRWDQRAGRTRRSPFNGIVDVGSIESGNTTSNSSMGLIGVPFGRVRRTGFVIAINASTGERKYAIVTLQGRYRLTNLDSAAVYVLDYHLKPGSRTPSVLAPEF